MLLYLTFSSSVLGHSPDQYSTRWSTCCGKGVCDDMYSDSSERVDGCSKYPLDWSRWKSHWYRKSHCGICTECWPCDQPFTNVGLPTVIRGRAILLQGDFQHPKNWTNSPDICLQGTSCDRYVLLYEEVISLWNQYAPGSLRVLCFMKWLFHLNASEKPVVNHIKKCTFPDSQCQGSSN